MARTGPKDKTNTAANLGFEKAQAKQRIIDQFVDDEMAGIERDNAALNGVLPKDYARPTLDKTCFGRFIDLAPTGLAGFVLANDSIASNQSGEGEMRKPNIEADMPGCAAGETCGRTGSCR